MWCSSQIAWFLYNRHAAYSISTTLVRPTIPIGLFLSGHRVSFNGEVLCTSSMCKYNNLNMHNCQSTPEQSIDIWDFFYKHSPSSLGSTVSQLSLIVVVH